MPEPHWIIAETMREAGWTCGYHEPVSTVGECMQCDKLHARFAERLLGALHTAGVRLVAVSQRPSVNGADNAVWLQAPYIEQEFSGDVVIADRLGLDAGELRDVALALLAAAEAVEQ